MTRREQTLCVYATRTTDCELTLSHIHLLHLSDLHYSGTAEDDRRIEKLLVDVNETLAKTPAYICFSGDLTFSGSLDQFQRLSEKLLLKLNGYSGLLMCPGNHDVDRTKTSEALVDRAKRKSEDKISFPDLISPFPDECPLDNYFLTQEALSDFSTNCYYTSAFNGVDFSILSLNTTWSSFSRERGHSDRGNLSINQRSLDLQLAALPSDRLSIMMMHHPLSWLDQESKRYLNDAILKKIDFVLSGHEHDPTSSSVQASQGSCIFIEATAAMANWSFGLNGYSLVSIDRDSRAVRIQHRTYSPPRDTFLDGNDIADGGVYYPRSSDRDYWVQEKSTNINSLLESISEKIDSTAIQATMSTAYSARIDTGSNPVIANFSRVAFKEGAREAGPKTAIMSCLDRIETTAFFVGPKDSGLTTSSQIAFQHIAKNIHKYRAIPIYMNIEDLSSINKATLLREVQRGFVSRLTRTEAKCVAESGSAFFLFDSVSIHDVSTISAIRQTLSDHFSHCRAAIFCTLDRRTSFQDGAGRVQLDPNEDTIFEICQLSAGEIKDLIDRKSPKEEETTKENLLNNAIISFKAMDEPIYATTASILIDTLKQLPNYKPINRVRLLDRYIECLLGRYTLDDIAVGEFNSSDKSNLLSFIAGQMVVREKTELSLIEMNEVIGGYTEEMLLEVPDDILDECFEKGILLSIGDRITFRANAMFSYFVAKEMVRNHDLFEKITSGDCFFSHNNEIVYFGELEGVDNSSLLDATEQYVRELGEVIVRQYSENGIDFALEWQKMVSPTEDDAPLLESKIDEIAKQVPSEADKDISRSSDLHSSPRSRGVHARSTIKEIEARWLISIRVYLQLLRNSSNVAGPDKVRHLRCALSALELFAQSLAVKREKISTNLAYSEGGILYINPLAGHDVEKSKRDFRINSNASVATMASDLMGTQQLGLALSRVSDSKNEFHNYIIRSLLMDIPSRDNCNFVVMSIANSEVPTLQIASLSALKEKYVSYRTSDSERKHQKLIIDGLNKERNIRRQLNVDQIDKRLALEKLRNPRAFKDSERSDS
ncbi:metallophosphoesterase [Chachezhania sediminis]|uniref:metallophosphoesterase n=1 Tax=Chachezhania sediminis TaxID=2599291 RepID=UPI00131AAE73|nr:metallophosphoesterase [Chachezhania sediminis]